MTDSLPHQFEISSELHAAPSDVWRFVTQMDNVNYELGPWIRMTTPRPGLSLTSSEFVPGRQLFRSWLLAFGVLPVDYDDLTLESVEAEHIFRERSSMLTQRAWHHDRELQTSERGTTLTDRLAWAPRLPGAGALFALVVPRLFGWRHRRLRSHFGGRLVTH